MTFDELVNTLEYADGLEVEVVVAPTIGPRSIFGGELAHDKDWHYVDDDSGDMPDDERFLGIRCRVGDTPDAASVGIPAAEFTDAAYIDHGHLVVQVIGGTVSIQAVGDELADFIQAIGE